MRFNILVLSSFIFTTFFLEYYILDSYMRILYTQNICFFHLETLYSVFVTFFTNLWLNLTFKTLTLNAIVFTLKFVLMIALLIFIRGGVPRYRYDFLTKIGWIKFLSLVLLIFLSSLLLVYLF